MSIEWRHNSNNIYCNNKQVEYLCYDYNNTKAMLSANNIIIVLSQSEDAGIISFLYKSGKNQ